MPSHYLNQWWNIVNWTLKNKLQWNLNWNSYIFNKENAIEMLSTQWLPFCLGLNVLTLCAMQNLSSSSNENIEQNINECVCLNMINSLAPGGFDYSIKLVNFKLTSTINILSIFHEIAITTPHWSFINIGSGNGLVPSGNKPLPEPMLTLIPVAIWGHWATMS